MFKALTPEERGKYDKLAAKDKERYKDAMTAYNKQPAEKEDDDDDDDSDGVDEDQGDDDDDDSD